MTYNTKEKIKLIHNLWFDASFELDTQIFKDFKIKHRTFDKLITEASEGTVNKKTLVLLNKIWKKYFYKITVIEEMNKWSDGNKFGEDDNTEQLWRYLKELKLILKSER